jgi:hypothetical protein
MSRGVLLRTYRYIERVGDEHAPDWFRRYLVLEAEAEEIWDWQPYRLPGLLQSEDYARALIENGGMAQDAETVEEWVQARLARQVRLSLPGGCNLVEVIDESAIRRVVGSPSIQAGALAHLLRVGTRSNVSIQVLPMGVDTSRTAIASLMTILRLPNGQEWLYSESLSRGHFVNDPSQVRRRRQRYHQIRAHALSVPDSRQLIRRTMEELINLVKPLESSSASPSWFKSSYSDGDGGSCIEVSADLLPSSVVPVRDSKDPQGPQLHFSTEAWASFAAATARGEFGEV